ncbi:MAG: peptide-modifying radical SAM enzyme CbpB [Desulfomonile tiedjei]|nr:peptide-modifying radical SAM enzyme CbpB [Desulfomonile tiedjei]
MKEVHNSAPSRGRYCNTGNGPTVQLIDIAHENYVALLDPDTAFWSLVKRDKIGDALNDSGVLMQEFRKKRDAFAREMEVLRFGLQPSAVYFNPTERCNLNCSYCYIPEEMRRDGVHMSEDQLIAALGILKDYFGKTMPEGRLPQVVFHGSEPMLARDAVFAGIERFRDDFHFGIQTNGTLLDDEAIDFLTSRGIGVGLSLDGHEEAIADATRKNWAGQGFFRRSAALLERFKGYPNYNVICTVTTRNMTALSNMVEFLHEMEVPIGMLNPVRCTRQGAREIRPADEDLSVHYLKALDRTYELYQETGRQLVIANFANVLISIAAPSARRLMCDISPCGGGRCFFAVGARGDLFPCSEFVGVPEFNGGNLFRDPIGDVLKSEAFKAVTGRKVEDIIPCSSCAVRHFCGSPCPAEAYEMNGGMNRTGAFCELYEEQVRYALRLIADGKESAFLWDGWDSATSTALEITSL